MDMSINFSVIIPAYNCENTIAKTVESILAANIDKIEVVIVDDGSTDDTDSVCQRLSQSKDNIRYYHKENSGVSDTRNYGVIHARGKYIMFWDSDDFAEPKLLNGCARKMIEQEPDMLIFGIEYRKMYHGRTFSADKLHCKTAQLLNSEDLAVSLGNLFDINYLQSSCNKILKTEICKKIKFNINKRSFEDFLYILEYLKYCEDIYIMPNMAYLYNVECSSTKPTREKKIVDFEEYMSEFQLAVLALEYKYGTELNELRKRIGWVYEWMLCNKIESSTLSELNGMDINKLQVILFGEPYMTNSRSIKFLLDGKIIVLRVYCILKQIKSNIKNTIKMVI